MSLSEKDRALKAALEEAFDEPIHIPLDDYLGKVLAGMFCRQPDISGDQRARLNAKERRAVDEVASGLLAAFALLQAAREEASQGAGEPVADPFAGQLAEAQADPEWLAKWHSPGSPTNPQARIDALEGAVKALEIKARALRYPNASTWDYGKANGLMEAVEKIEAALNQGADHD